MKFNESPEEKKMRLKRCLIALSKSGVGKPSAFVGMQVGKPVEIEWNRSSSSNNIIEDASEADNSGFRFMKVGKKIVDNDGF